MGVAVSAHNSASIHRENNRQIVQADIMNDLVVSTLQKGPFCAGKQSVPASRFLLPARSVCPVQPDSPVLVTLFPEPTSRSLIYLRSYVALGQRGTWAA